jgi:hypothetical protein
MGRQKLRHAKIVIEPLPMAGGRGSSFFDYLLTSLHLVKLSFLPSPTCKPTTSFATIFVFFVGRLYVTDAPLSH